ncbi:MAG: hypothetical protein J2P13_09285 [Acidobacteria bacterium]|nr:hypothetical protein [Acidobacteriota bacterium]
MIPFLCIAASAAALYYVFNLPELVSAGPEKTRSAYLRERKDVVYENLRDLNFEYKAGKVPEADYQSMQDSLEEEAGALLAEISQLESEPSHVESR